MNRETLQVSFLLPREKLLETSPIAHASSLRNILLIHGEGDDVVPIIHSERLCDKVREAGNSCEIVKLNMRHSPPKHLYGEIENVIVNWVNSLCKKEYCLALRNLVKIFLTRSLPFVAEMR